MIAAGALSDPQLHDLVQRHDDGWTTAHHAQTADAVRRLTDDVLARVEDDDAAEQELREHSALWHLTDDDGSPRA